MNTNQTTDIRMAVICIIRFIGTIRILALNQKP